MRQNSEIVLNVWFNRGELLSSSSRFCSLDSTTPRYRVDRLSNIAGRRFLRRHVYPALCRILEERGRERGRERSHDDHRDEIYYMFPT